MKLLRYFWFWIFAYNRHGIHSPYVYELLEKCIFSNDMKSRVANFQIHKQQLTYFDKKRACLFVKLIDFYKPIRLIWIGNDHQHLLDFLKKIHGTTKFYQIETTNTSLETLPKILEKCEATNWFVFDSKMETLLNDPIRSAIKNHVNNETKFFLIEANGVPNLSELKIDCRVVLDFYFLKILLFRSEMNPQFFWLRS